MSPSSSVASLNSNSKNSNSNTNTLPTKRANATTNNKTAAPTSTLNGNSKANNNNSYLISNAALRSPAAAGSHRGITARRPLRTPTSSPLATTPTNHSHSTAPTTRFVSQNSKTKYKSYKANNQNYCIKNKNKKKKQRKELNHENALNLRIICENGKQSSISTPRSTHIRRNHEWTRKLSRPYREQLFFPLIIRWCEFQRFWRKSSNLCISVVFLFVEFGYFRQFYSNYWFPVVRWIMNTFRQLKNENIIF